jgi:hypothetical protein
MRITGRTTNPSSIMNGLTKLLLAVLAAGAPLSYAGAGPRIQTPFGASRAQAAQENKPTTACTQILVSRPGSSKQAHFIAVAWLKWPRTTGAAGRLALEATNPKSPFER